MDKKIILELIKKDLEELRILVDALEQNPADETILIDIASSKTKTLLQEITLLKSENSGNPFSDNIETENENLIQEEIQELTQENETALKTEAILEILEREEDKIQESVSKEEKTEVSIEEYPETKQEENKVIEETQQVQVEIAEKLSIEGQSAKETDMEIETVEDVVVKVENEIIISEEKTIVETTVKESKILGENFTKEPSLNERFASINNQKSKVVGKPVTSIKGAIGINDKFMFTRELFDNNPEKFAATIETLDNAGGLLEAVEHLEQNFKWQKNDTSLKFMQLVKRRFED